MNRILLLAVVVAGCLLSSCTRITEEQGKQLAQAKADVEAARQVEDQEARNALYASASSRLMAGLFDVELPPPFVPAATLARDPVAVQTEVKESMAAEKDPPSGTGTAWAWIAGGGLAALGLLRFVPGAGGMVANLAYSYFASKVDKDVDRKAHQLYQHGAAVVQYGVEMAHVAEAVAPAEAAAIQERAIEIQQKLGLKETIEQLVVAAKASAQKMPLGDRGGDHG
jgi:hypothetical protein